MSSMPLNVTYFPIATWSTGEAHHSFRLLCASKCILRSGEFWLSVSQNQVQQSKAIIQRYLQRAKWQPHDMTKILGRPNFQNNLQ